MPPKGSKMSEGHKRKISIAHTGKKRAPFSDECRRHMSEAHKGKPHPNKPHPCSIETRKKIAKSKLGIPCSIETKQKISKKLSGEGGYWYGKKRPESTRLKLAESRRGSKSHFWKGGINKENLKIRGSIEYALWRESVFKRDGYKCVLCKNGGKLNADHIKPFSLFPELRFVLANGRTLCVECHKKTETFGNKVYNYKA